MLKANSNGPHAVTAAHQRASGEAMSHSGSRVACLVEVVLSGASQGLDDSVVIHPLAAVLLKAYVMADPTVAARWEIVTLNVREDQSPRATAEAVVALRPDLVGFCVYTWNELHIRAATTRLAELRPDARIVWGGPQVSHDAAERIQRFPAVHAVVCGPGEEPLRRILTALADSDEIPAVPGVARRVGALPALAPGSCGDDLSRIPSPFQMGLIDLSGPGPHAVYLETFRGCVHSCGFCVWGASRSGLDFYPLEQVLEDVRIVYNTPNVANVYFVDAYIFYNPKRAEAILQTIYACRYLHPTFFEFDPRHLRPEHVRLVARAANHEYRLGVQTFDGEALRTAGRRGKPQDVELATEMIRREDPQARVSFALIYGLPGDSLAGFRASVADALRLRADSMKLNILSVLPGSQFWKDRDRHGLVFEDDPPHRLRSSHDFSADDLHACATLSAWILLLLREPTVKAGLHEAAQHHDQQQVMELIDRMVASLRVELAYVEPAFQTNGVSVEQENQHRMRLLRAGADPDTRRVLSSAWRRCAAEMGIDATLPAEVLPRRPVGWLQ